MCDGKALRTVGLLLCDGIWLWGEEQLKGCSFYVLSESCSAPGCIQDKLKTPVSFELASMSEMRYVRASLPLVYLRPKSI